MKDRLHKILSENNLTSAKFADKIGVQASRVSHTLSGRNNPSYDFIQKLLDNFPDISAEWLIQGKGSMYNDISNSPTLFDQVDENSNEDIEVIENENLVKSEDPVEYKKVKSEVTEKELVKKQAISVEKVILFYSDGSFKQYSPNDANL